MGKISGVLLFGMFFTAGLVIAEIGEPALLNGVEHFKQSTLRIQGEKTVYFDPYQFSGEPKNGDLIFVSHTHGDHYSVTDLQKVMKPDATLVIPEDGAEKAKAAGITKIVTVVPNKSYEIDGVKFETVPAYNTNKQYHPREKNWVGYIVTLNKVRYYMAGDTDLIPEMKDFKVDVAFLPVGGTYTMTAREAAQAANLFKPKVAVPIHFADVVGGVGDAKQFIGLLNQGIKGIILKKD